MQIQRLFVVLVATLTILSSPILVRADESAPPPRPGKEFCKANPEKCEQMQARRAARREFCQANPEKCQEQRAQLKERRAELQAKCQADPAKCEEMKDQARKRFQDRMGGPPPPAPPPAK
ncbi:MAG: hypothetical protein EXR82_08275 [Gammaproteobacteria bacterium]|nr:hypothetical protein [Gammaproteobacteria bacterium]